MKTFLDRATALGKRVADSAGQVVKEIDTTSAKSYLDKAQKTAAEQATRAGAVISDGYQALSESKAGHLVKESWTKTAALATDFGEDLRSKIQFNTSGESDSALPKTEADKIRKSIDALSGKDRIGLLGEGLCAVTGAVGGVAASGTIASWAGASTLLGSSALGSALGGVFVTTTPVGWVIGSAVLVGIAGYGAAKLVRSGSQQDVIRAELITTLTDKLNTVKDDQPENSEVINELNQIAAMCIAGGIMDESQTARMISMIKEGKMSAELALERLKRKAFAAGIIEPA